MASGAAPVGASGADNKEAHKPKSLIAYCREYIKNHEDDWPADKDARIAFVKARAQEIGKVLNDTQAHLFAMNLGAANASSDFFKKHSDT